MLLQHERSYDLGMAAPVGRMLLEQERNYDLGMDALRSFRTAGAESSTCCTHVQSYHDGTLRQAVC